MSLFESKKKSELWNFPNGQGLTYSGINLPGIDTFSDIPIDSITREGIQNSLDAKDTSINEPVIVRFDLSNVLSSNIPGVEQLKFKVTPKMRETWQDSEPAIDFLDTYDKVLAAETVPVLTISDFNTRGLAEKNWNSLIFVAGDSVKDDEGSAGSKGIGKFAPFAASNLRMVFYHTISEGEGERAIGVSQLMSFDYSPEGEVTQGPAYYSKGIRNGKYQPLDSELPFQVNRKKRQFGTDLFVVGFKEDEYWQNRIKMSVLSNFLVSIWTGELKVYIGDEIIDKTTLPELFNYFNNLENKNKGKRNVFRVTDDFKDAFRSFQVLNNPNVVEVKLPNDMVTKYEFIDSVDDANMKLALLEDTNRKILQTRKSGMKINYKNKISGSINFFGVFQATGQKLNKFLKNIENGNHDNWYVDRIIDKGKKSIAEDFLHDLTRFYKKSVNDIYNTNTKEVMDIFGLDNILTVRNNFTPNNIKKRPTLKQKISTLDIKQNSINKRTTKSQSSQQQNENQLIDVLFGGDGDEETVIRGSERRNSVGEHQIDPKNSRPATKRGAELSDVNVYFIEVNPGNGEYRISIQSTKKRAQVEIELQIIGENGFTDKVRIEKFDLLNSELLSDYSLLVKNIKKGKMISGKIKINSNSRIRLGGKVYEIKR